MKLKMPRKNLLMRRLWRLWRVRAIFSLQSRGLSKSPIPTNRQTAPFPLTRLVVGGIALLFVSSLALAGERGRAGAGARDLILGKLVENEDVLVLIDLGGLMARPELVVDQKQQEESNR